MVPRFAPRGSLKNLRKQMSSLKVAREHDERPSFLVLNSKANELNIEIFVGISQKLRESRGRI